ncbi:hypothetical protein SAMN05421827_10461 [Pedobacter terrae]|uniref:Uncharacterized protein n=1 Tax=Pedobacter terrae TaxID=405671 RepID=A0A1G7S8Y9_9SPHI|nr:hypothetical protein [Pedobacter terrae]SDG18640.1 hypothetical protein SAMN05421827_10461 [Pedobacter terrae]
MREKINDFLTIAVIITIAVLFLLFFLPFIMISKINYYFEKKKTDKLYTDYLLKIDGHKFFCYNNKKHAQEFIENQIIPTLPKDVKIIFLDGRTPRSEYTKSFASKILYRIQNQVGFPYLLRVQEGIVLEKSINNELYNSLNQGHDTEPLYEAINKFYQ